ncbi:MAG: hypothetical protein GY941_04535 [Planctomycetes bacterium]|nr:hypothetical protein [Planctomycetota bacterium]
MSNSNNYNSKRLESSPQINPKTIDLNWANEPFRVSFRTIPLIALSPMHFDWVMVQGIGLDRDGLEFCYEDNITSGTLLELKIMHPEATSTLHCIGKVIQSGKSCHSPLFNIASEFIKLGERGKELIQSF